MNIEQKARDDELYMIIIQQKVKIQIMDDLPRKKGNRSRLKSTQLYPIITSRRSKSENHKNKIVTSDHQRRICIMKSTISKNPCDGV